MLDPRTQILVHPSTNIIIYFTHYHIPIKNPCNLSAQIKKLDCLHLHENASNIHSTLFRQHKPHPLLTQYFTIPILPNRFQAYADHKVLFFALINFCSLGLLYRCKMTG